MNAPALRALLLALVVVPAAAAPSGAADRRAGSDMVFGARPAQVFEEAYDGPAVVGEFVTLAPALASLPPGNRDHEVRVDIVAQEIEVAPGVRFAAWTFGGSVPGPVLHVREGDRVVFTTKNRTDELVGLPTLSEASPFLAQRAVTSPQLGVPAIAPMPHGIDFHSGTVAPNDKWRPIQPGQSIRMEWTANYPGVYLYHCSQPPVLLHMAMGQYGVVVVSPKDGYPTDDQVDREYVVVQSEFYLAPIEGAEESGPSHALDFAAAAERRPSHVLFNGHARAFADRPLEAEPGERVRLYVHNVGPSGTSSFHVIGTIFDTVYYEGNPANLWRGMQTVLLGASNGAVVEFIVPEAGNYPFVDHEFADATLGAVGMLRAGSVAREGAASH
jgi:nitrite reductase (NO-forming)